MFDSVTVNESLCTPMASASCSSLRTWRYRVFTSFHGPDVRKTFLSHLRKQFNCNGITMFDDQGIERSQTIAPALQRAIRESRISIIVLSKNYASSSWCLNELLEILKCKEDMGQIVMTVFYGVDPSDVRKQTGKFGIAFNGACKTEEKMRIWSQALTYVANIAGEHFQNWDNEAKMIEKIANDVSDKLNATRSRDFDGMVGLESHLREIYSLLDFNSDEVKMVGISGPAGIGKSTIARALHSILSNKFQYTCFMDNLRESCKTGLGEYGLKKRLHEQLLSKLLNLDDIRICHLGVIQERVYDQRVLIILDDVESLDQLDTLADIRWFGPGSRIIVCTQNKEILQQHGINDIYVVGFPSEKEALMIFCLSAFRQTCPADGFQELASEVLRICGDLPLGLHVLGSLLRGKSQADWIDELPRLKNCLDGRIESVLKVGYDSLHEKDQALFLNIAVFFNYENVDHVTSMLAKNNLDVRLGLKILANKYLIHNPWFESMVVMHGLLQVMARQVISRQEPWKRHILVDAREICYVLENQAGNGSTVGVSFDVVDINELIISARAFERMYNLVFLKVYNGQPGNRQLHIQEEFEFPRCLRLLNWDAYPKKSLPLRFCPEHLVELNMPYSQLEKLWEGTQPLINLKKMYLFWAYRLNKLPDLSNATNLEILDLTSCSSLEELPSSISNLQKLVHLFMSSCKSLEVIPTLINLASLERIDMYACSRLRCFPEFPTNITKLSVTDTLVEELHASLRHCSRLETLDISGSVHLKTLRHLPTNLTHLHVSNSGIEKISDCIKDLHGLEFLDISSCKQLTSLPEVPRSLKSLRAVDCESLEKISTSFNIPNSELSFTNCIKLGPQELQLGSIIQQTLVRGWSFVPGREVPAEFYHRATGNSLTVPNYGFSRFKVCVVISPKPKRYISSAELLCRCTVVSNLVNYTDMSISISDVSRFRTEHLFIFHSALPFIDDHSEVTRKIELQFSSRLKNFDITECGIQILTDGSSNGESGDKDGVFDTWYRHESGETLDEEEDEDYSDYESDKTSDKEDVEEGYKSESGEGTRGCIVDDGDYKSVSRKRPRKTTMTSDTTNMKCGVQRQRF